MGFLFLFPDVRNWLLLLLLWLLWLLLLLSPEFCVLGTFLRQGTIAAKPQNPKIGRGAV